MITRDRKLDDLDPSFKPKAFEFLARCSEAGIMLCIVETRRSEEAHQEDLASGRSWVQHSKHQDGLALDVAPYETYLLHGPDKIQWNAEDPVWARIAEIAEACGLKSGYRWKVKDCGHVEI